MNTNSQPSFDEVHEMKDILTTRIDAIRENYNNGTASQQAAHECLTQIYMMLEENYDTQINQWYPYQVDLKEISKYAKHYNFTKPNSRGLP